MPSQFGPHPYLEQERWDTWILMLVIYTVIFVPFHLGFAFTGATLTLSTPGPLPAACQQQPVGCSHSQFAQLFGSCSRSHSCSHSCSYLCSHLCSHSAPSMQAMQPATPA